jgi:signal transduction histidine kinase
VQELVSLDIMLSAVRSSLEHDDREGALSSVNEAQAIAERNIRSLREEIVGLGPYAFDELTVMAALEQCAPLWARRYGFDIRLDIEDLDLPDDVCGALFGVAQEAVANAGRHAGADTVTVSLHQHDGQVVMHVRDDGSGFGDIAPLGAHEVGHIGLASMRERAELIGGLLEIDSGPEGTDVGVRVLLEDPQPTKRRRRFRPSAG